MKFNYIYMTAQGRVTVPAETKEQADTAILNTRKFTRVRFVGKEIARCGNSCTSCKCKNIS